MFDVFLKLALVFFGSVDGVAGVVYWLRRRCWSKWCDDIFVIVDAVIIVIAVALVSFFAAFTIVFDDSFVPSSFFYYYYLFIS